MTRREMALAGAAVLLSAAAGLGVYVWQSTSRLIDPDAIVRMSERAQMGTSAPKDPRQAIFIRLSLKGNGEINVSYAAMAEYKFKQNETITSIIDNMLVPDSSGKTWEPPWKPHKLYRPIKKAVSRLSIRNKELSYIVFLLDCTNCRFMRNATPFRVEKDNEELYVDPRVAWFDGEPKHAPAPGDRAESKIGYFIAASDTDLGSTQEFQTHFNIYLDLSYPNETMAIPISIDPDVGYPGGHTPEPTCTGTNCGLASPPKAPPGAGKS